MKQMREMMQKMAELIRKLPDMKPYRYPSYPPGLGMQPKKEEVTAVPLQNKNMCREFMRQGHCRWGDKCKFSHSQAKVMLAEMSEADEHAVQLQGTMMGMWNHAEAGLSDGERNMTPREFEEAYDDAYHFIGTDGFDQLHDEMVVMLAQEQEIGDARSSVDGWHL